MRTRLRLLVALLAGAAAGLAAAGIYDVVTPGTGGVRWVQGAQEFPYDMLVADSIPPGLYVDRDFVLEVMRAQNELIRSLANPGSESLWRRLLGEWKLWAAGFFVLGCCFVSLLVFVVGSPPDRVVRFSESARKWWGLLPWRSG